MIPIAIKRRLAGPSAGALLRPVRGALRAAAVALGPRRPASPTTVTDPVPPPAAPVAEVGPAAGSSAAAPADAQSACRV